VGTSGEPDVTPLPCEYSVPLPASPLIEMNYAQAMVVHYPLGGTPQLVPYVTSLAACDPAHGGWYYDVDPLYYLPSKLIMCPCTCASLGGGTIELLFGCRQIPVPID
jgi:hypothetical protein